MKIVEIWPLGYAHFDGLKVIRIEDDADPQVAALQFGALARVYSVRSATPRKVEPVSEAYARMMSQKDNS